MNYNQSSRLRLEFVTYDGVLEASVNQDGEGDVVSGSVDKSINQPAGGFRFTLVPRQHYLDKVHAGDWVKIYFGDGTLLSDTAPYMIGVIDRVNRTRAVDSKGALTELITVSGRDYGKVLLGIQLVFDPTISNPSTVKALTSFMGSYVVNASDNSFPQKSKSKFKTPGRLIQALLRLFHDYRNQLVPPDGVLSSSKEVKAGDKIAALDYITYVYAGEGIVPFNGSPNLSGNLWGAIEQISNSFTSELWVDTIYGVPTLIFRKHPFSAADFSALGDSLGVLIVDANEISNEDISTSDQEVMNWFRVHMEGSVGGVGDVSSAVGVGAITPASIHKFGVKRYSPTTVLWGNGEVVLDKTQVGEIKGMLQRMSMMVSEWHWGNEKLMSGTMTGRLRVDARPGKRFDYTNQASGESLSFYIEGVTHTFAYPGASSTSYTLTRGVHREGSGSGVTFPHLQTIDALSDVTKTKGKPTVVKIYDFNKQLLDASLKKEGFLVTKDASKLDLSAAAEGIQSAKSLAIETTSNALIKAGSGVDIIHKGTK